ncbi:MAG: NAD(P)-dependent alcohol dehydrogenase [Rhodospirillaceae bacterium]|nr:NAD(P)-dependent alcohol dehydrogenase [Rhodospirillaceae bacterium]
MKAYQVTSNKGIDSLQVSDIECGNLGPSDVRVRLRASSVNYRDLVTVEKPEARGLVHPFIPNSDGAGEVVAVGRDVEDFAVGDRVMTCFFQDWLDGPITSSAMNSALGGAAEGVLRETGIFKKEGIIKIPGSLSYIEAATLPCAALTAWHALVERGRVIAGDTVLLLGTGGVSLFALQFAVMHGALPIITSSNDEKLEKAKALGAWKTINYLDNPDWHDEVLALTSGAGVDHVVEVGGAGTLTQSIQSTKIGGSIYLIGILADGQVNPTFLMRKSLNLYGIYVGSRAMFERMNRAIQANKLHPVVHHIFPFEEAKKAYRMMRTKQHFGKIVIDIGGQL